MADSSISGRRGDEKACMSRLAILLCVVGFLCLSCQPKNDKSGNIQSGADVSVPSSASKELVLAEGTLESEVKVSVDSFLDDYFSRSWKEKFKQSGIAIGILINGVVVYTRCYGLTRGGASGNRVTRQTMFNVHPMNPFKSAEELNMFTIEGFAKAGVVVPATPDGSYAYPHAAFVRDANEEETNDFVELSFDVVGQKGVLWASLDGVMRYLVTNPNLEGLKTSFDFKQEVLSQSMNGSGYHVDVAWVPSKKIHIIVLENSEGLPSIVESLLTRLMPDEVKAVEEEEDLEEEEMEPNLRQIYYALDKKEDFEGGCAKYKCDGGYDDFEIVWDGKSYVLETARWRSRIGAYDTYDASMVTITDEGEIDLEDAETTYRLLDAPVADVRMVPTFDAHNRLESIELGYMIDGYERLGETVYHFRTIEPFTVCMREP